MATQGKDALQELERWRGAACSEAHLVEMRGYLTVIAIFRKWFISITSVPQCSSWSMKVHQYLSRAR
ncbi:CSS-motif domain-containing protein [Shigella flexneri]